MGFRDWWDSEVCLKYVDEIYGFKGFDRPRALADNTMSCSGHHHKVHGCSLSLLACFNSR